MDKVRSEVAVKREPSSDGMLSLAKPMEATCSAPSERHPILCGSLCKERLAEAATEER